MKRGRPVAFAEQLDQDESPMSEGRLSVSPSARRLEFSRILEYGLT